jgi:hypothetical protein
MAIITAIAARDVCRVLAGGRYAIVAGATVAEHLQVIYRYNR